MEKENSFLGVLIVAGLLAALLWATASVIHLGDQISQLSIKSRVPRPKPMPTLEIPALSEHALQHADSVAAYDWVRVNGQYCRYKCPDGRARFVCQLSGGTSGGRYAVVVLDEKGGSVITAFTSIRDYALGIIDGCENPWRFLHP